jgi:hypothetical protein
MGFLARLESDFEKYSGHGSGGAVTVNWRRGATSWARASTTKTYDTDQASKRLIAFAIPAPERRRRRWVALSAIQERATRSAKPIAHFVVLQTVIVRPGKFPQPNQQNRWKLSFSNSSSRLGFPSVCVFGVCWWQRVCCVYISCGPPHCPARPHSFTPHFQRNRSTLSLHCQRTVRISVTTRA